MRIAGMIQNSLANGPGMRFVIFLQGCAHDCEGCHNKHTHDINGGYDMSVEDIVLKIKNEEGFIKGITISGGEPLLQSKEVYKLIEKIRNDISNIDIILYTGFKVEEICHNKKAIKVIKACDYVIDGKFEKNNTEDCHRYTGSSNQRFLSKEDIDKIIG